MSEPGSQQLDGQRLATPGPMVPVVFLPGIVQPAALRYARLLDELGDSVRPLVKDLEVYADPTPPVGYEIEHEVAGVARAADAAGLDRFHLYGHSGGGAIALAFAASHPGRVLSLAMDEPASDFSPEAATELADRLAGIDQLPPPARVKAFLQMQLAPGVALPPPPPGPPPSWMERRPAGIDAFAGAVQRYALSSEHLLAVGCPVFFTFGSLSWSYWERMRDCLAGRLPRFSWELYEGAHHLVTSHHREPARVAAAFRRLWRDAGRGDE